MQSFSLGMEVRRGLASQTSLLDASPLHPAFRKLPAPLIVIGAHRSGTSMVAGMLELLGVDMGTRSPLQPGLQVDTHLRSSGYSEGFDAYLLNELLLARAGAAWHTPGPFLETRDTTAARRAGLCCLTAATYGQLRRTYARGPLEDRRWGWKDPRTSLTLPYWLRLFPTARVIHVHRDPARAARSLHARAHRATAFSVGATASPAQHTPPPLPLDFRAQWVLLQPRRILERTGLVPTRSAGTSSADPCLDQEYCLRLTNEYLAECFRVRRRAADCLELHYEAVLEDPHGTAVQLARFAGLAPDAPAVEHAAAFVAPEATR